MMYGETLRPPHCSATPAAVIANKKKLSSFKSSKHIIARCTQLKALKRTCVSKGRNVNLTPHS